MSKQEFEFKKLEVPQFGMAFNVLNRDLITAEHPEEWTPAVRALDHLLDVLDQKLISDHTIIA
ncbi:MAG: hypothetical protein SVP52_00280, partial [Chloroflexota bacterium]|nr:hypothetical protein [Chloroflexota bacterium]